MAAHWAEVFLDELEAHTKIDEQTAEQVLASKGVDADDVNAVAGMKSAGVTDVMKVLGGLVAKALWWVVVRPFLAVGKFVASGKFRSEVLAAFKKAVRHEVRATRHMASVAGRLVRGEPVHPAEKKAAMKQLTTLLVQVVVMYLAGGPLLGFFKGALWSSLTALVGPVSEIVLVLFGAPIKAATAKLLSADIAQFPGSRG